VGANSAIYSSVTSQKQKKENIYNQMSQLLMGYNTDGSILELDEDGNILAGGTKIRDAVFFPFSRLLVKDEVKKGTFTMSLGVAQSDTAPFTATVNVTDASGSDGYFVNSPVGEYGILFAGNGTGTPLATNNVPCGLLFYQAGIAVLTSSVFQGLLTTACHMNTANNSLSDLLTGSTVQTTANSIRQRIDNIQFNNTTELNSTIYFCRQRIDNIQFNNTTELNSTIYFCRINHNEFNYSTNPTYVNASKIRVKTNSTDEPISYITTIGLYSDKNELMAVAKLSEPLKKSPSTEFTIRARLDY
jgi:hypothetical protein